MACLFKLAAGSPTHFRATTPQIVGGDSGDSRGGGVRLEQLPDDLFAETGALRVAAAPASASVGVTTGGNWRGAIRV